MQGPSRTSSGRCPAGALARRGHGGGREVDAEPSGRRLQHADRPGHKAEGTRGTPGRSGGAGRPRGLRPGVTVPQEPPGRRVAPAGAERVPGTRGADTPPAVAPVPRPHAPAARLPLAPRTRSESHDQLRPLSRRVSPRSFQRRHLCRSRRHCAPLPLEDTRLALGLPRGPRPEDARSGQRPLRAPRLCRGPGHPRSGRSPAPAAASPAARPLPARRGRAGFAASIVSGPTRCRPTLRGLGGLSA